MGNDVSRARVLTVSSFLVNFGVQTYGMITTPNMKDIAEANHFAFSPNPWFIAAFFSGQVVIQLAWIRKLFQNDPHNDYQPIASKPSSTNVAHDASKLLTTEEKHAWKVALNYAPVYALGNFCIAGWLYFWLQENFVTSQVLVTINTFAQLAAVAALPPLSPDSPMLHRLTHLVAKTFAGIGVLDFIDNGGVALGYRAPPSPMVQALTYALFPIVTTTSSPLFGSVLLYDLVAVTVGQAGVLGAGPWPTRLGWTSMVTSFIVLAKAIPTVGQYLRR